MARRVQVDAAILGGGIAGLWTLARLRGLGYACVLLEPRALGTGQTLASQGIIHGGIKYALTGAASRASRAIAEMPAIWSACLRGEGPLDLSSARVLSDHQHLWTTAGIGARLVGLAASKVIRTGVTRVEREDRAEVFAGAPRAVDVYRVEEPVLDVRSVLAALLEQAGGERVVVKCAGDAQGAGLRLRAGDARVGAVSGAFDGTGEVEIRAARYIFTAGAGNEFLLQQAGVKGAEARMQRRPLHMVLIRERAHGSSAPLPELFGHCITGSLSDKPRITVTSARDDEGRRVWYLGGRLSEEGVARTREDQIDAARNELRECLPWLAWDASALEWATLRVDRAEGLTPDGSRPDEPVVTMIANMIVAWPTKLAFAPATADRIIGMLREDGVAPGCNDPPEVIATALEGFPRPALGQPPWNDRSGGIAWTS